jgi:hypothetical protein
MLALESPLPSFKKRLTNEAPLLMKKYPLAVLDFETRLAKLYIDISGINVCISFDFNYPFRPPKSITLNGVSYNRYLRFPSRGHECTCCDSITCSGKWTPGFKSFHLLDEISENIYLKQKRTYLILIKIIKNKYLVSDIPIEDWI